MVLSIDISIQSQLKLSINYLFSQLNFKGHNHYINLKRVYIIQVIVYKMDAEIIQWLLLTGATSHCSYFHSSDASEITSDIVPVNDAHRSYISTGCQLVSFKV